MITNIKYLLGSQIKKSDITPPAHKSFKLYTSFLFKEMEIISCLKWFKLIKVLDFFSMNYIYNIFSKILDFETKK